MYVTMITKKRGYKLVGGMEGAGGRAWEELEGEPGRRWRESLGGAGGRMLGRRCRESAWEEVQGEPGRWCRESTVLILYQLKNLRV